MNDQATLDERCINTIRFLAIDAIQKANSGHPGMPMGAAAMAYVLWQRHLKHNPANPAWMDRDRRGPKGWGLSRAMRVIPIPSGQMGVFRQSQQAAEPSVRVVALENGWGDTHMKEKYEGDITELLPDDAVFQKSSCGRDHGPTEFYEPSHPSEAE